MWIFIWLVLSAIVLGTTLWSFRILILQKRAWEKYAKDKKFVFRRGTLMGPAEMEGMLGEYKVSFFTAEREGMDMRSRRYVTVMEIGLAEGMVDGGIVGTKEMLPFMQSLNKLHVYKVTHPSWEEGMHAFVHNDGAVEAYLTDERIEAITQVLKTKNADAVIIFNDREILIRLETIDPIQDAEKIDKVVKRTIGLCERLRLTPDQRSAYMAASGAPPEIIPL